MSATDPIVQTPTESSEGSKHFSAEKAPLPKPRFDKRTIDVSKVFLAYMTFVGDVERTAAALDMHPDTVRQLAEQEGWHGKIQRVNALTKSGQPGDYERGVNRALSFVQAHRIRLLLDRVLRRYEDLTDDELDARLETVGRGGTRAFSCRFMADFTAAMEKAQHLAYLALGDSLAEREMRGKPDDEVEATTIHAAVIAALNNPRALGLDDKLLSQVVEQEATIDRAHDLCQNGTVRQNVPSSEKPEVSVASVPLKPAGT